MKLAHARIGDILLQHKKLLRFLTVGILTAFVYFSLFTLFWKAFQWNDKIAVSFSYCFSVVFQFFCNRHLTFKSTNENILYQAVKFCALLVINYLLTMLIVTWSVNTLLLSPYLGIIISLTVTVFTGFFISRMWVFKAATTRLEKTSETYV